jgi:hypothetical protein
MWTILVLFELQVYPQRARNMSLLFLSDEHRTERQRASPGGQYIDGIRWVSQPFPLAPALRRS